MDITKAFIPAMNPTKRGTPLARALPHALMPILSKPLLQYSAEEAYAASLETLMVVSVNDHDQIMRLFQEHHGNENKRELSLFDRLSRHMTIASINQGESRGLAHALWLTRMFMNSKEYVAYINPNDFIASEQPTIGTLIRIARQEKVTILAVREISETEAPHNTVISIKKQISPVLFQVGSFVRNPSSHAAPSNLAIVGRAVLSPKIFGILNELAGADASQEPDLLDAVGNLVHHSERVYAFKLSDPYFSVATVSGIFAASLHMAQQHPVLADQLMNHLTTYTPEIMAPHGAARSIQTTAQ